ncbi:MAG TPA: aldo/keto reductase [Vicinamibacterales bacterium]|nr:aldo/keto reductase [Vicinamibacterales bacterium]
MGIIARVPLASGLLTGTIRADSVFPLDDHRHFNRHGEQFDQGETFSGVPLDAALAAVDELRALVPAGATLAQFALRWVLMWDAVTCVIPGAKRAAQVRENVAAGRLDALTEKTMTAARDVYDRLIRSHAHSRS